MTQAPGWRLGHVAGVPVFVARSWLVIAAVVVLFFGPGLARERPDLGVLAYLVAGVYAIALLGSVLVHEVAHAVAAQRVGLPPQHIVITLWGGHTQFVSHASSPGRSLFVAVVGPLANGGLAVLAWAALWVLPVSGVGYRVVLGLAVTNALVAVFNLVPGLPLDGGRVLEALIWKVSGRRETGTLVAGWTGRAVAAAVVVYALAPVLAGRPPSLVLVVWAAIIGAMLWTAAGQAIGAAQVDRRARQVSLPALMQPAAAAPVGTTVAQALTSGTGVALVVVTPDGQPAGVVDPDALAQVPVDRRDLVGVLSVARRLEPGAVLDARLSGEPLLDALRSRPANEYAVVDAGRVVGVVDVQAVLRALTRASSRSA